ncbi:ribbon-helix-helix domain-containing protein [Micromonospora zhanjiangensis]|uniref:CopG-like ribbon-helix-helix domain-containing protein n=1 Tax=Micromonospora zhanjiangensis TaxID=1522057 RepID=A0ABV8KM90_9ACTN
MATRRLTVALPEELVEALGVVAAEDGVPVSRLVADATERGLRRRLGQHLLVEWQAEHGAFTPDELAAARAEMVAADRLLTPST